MRSEWIIQTVEECTEKIIDYRGKTPNKTTFGVPLITAKIVKGGRIEEPTEFIAESEYDEWMSRGIPFRGDVLLTVEAPLGEVAQITDERIALAQRIILLRGKRGILDNTFLKYSFMESFVRGQLIARESGTTVMGIKQSELRKVKIPIPPLLEQKAIARVLSSLDDKIELNRRTNATLESLAQTLFRAWFVDFEPVKAKVAGALPSGMDARTAALFPSELEQSTLGLIPKGWKIQSLNEAFEINPSRRSPSSTYLDMANVQTQGHRPFGWVQREPKSGMKFINGDTLLARITPCLENGKTAFVDFLKVGEVGWGSTEFIVMRPRAPLPEYFAYLLCRHDDFRNFAIQSMTGTSGRQRIQTSSLSQYSLAIPGEEICAKFSELIQPLIQRIARNAEQSQTLAQLRDALLPRLISGRLRVPDVMKVFDEIQP